jgi:hypothetical protein
VTKEKEMEEQRQGSLADAPAANQELTTEQVDAVAGGDATVTVNTGIVNVEQTAPTPGEALIAIYEGAVAFTSHVIGRVLGETTD